MANRLKKEKSPYLLQHANNPVDWYPWGEEAFIKAKNEDKPVFLSVGYSTCHWCHVMARESFEDDEVARLLNEHYVAVKVDREERPDIDYIYMSVCQAMTGQGGWPLTVVLTPDKKPFFAGTYFPKESRWGRPGLLAALARINDMWATKRGHLTEIGEEIMGLLRPSDVQDEGEVSAEILHKAFGQLKSRFDPQYGGFGEAPKFPSPHNLMFLLRYARQHNEPQALEMVEKTLTGMFYGGIYDHIGSGFARYSTDRRWLTPHFEKMLYDNAMLAYTYLEAFQVTGRRLYARIAREVFAYAGREMTSPQGGFYSARDADSEGVEGKFYLWSVEEVKNILGGKEANTFCQLYDITEKGNFENNKGKSIPNLIKSSQREDAQLLNTIETLQNSTQKLFLAREKRVPPHKDDKILTSWNGLMIAALAKGASVLQEPECTGAASRAVNFIWEKMRSSDGRLLARYRDGEAAFPAYLDDYAFLTWGLLELYEATFMPDYLKKAIALTEQMIDLFWDKEGGGGFFFYGSDAEQLLVRPKELYDGAIPSGNSVAALNLLRLGRLTGNQQLNDLAWKQIKIFVGEARRFPMGHTFFLNALIFALGRAKEVIVVGKAEDKQTQSILQSLQKEFYPGAVVVFNPQNGKSEELTKIVPFLSQYESRQEKTTVYVCENYACQAPVTDLAQLRRIMAEN